MSEHKPLVDQQDALAIYLRDMLQETTTVEFPVTEQLLAIKTERVQTALLSSRPSVPFQALLFEVNDVPLALPLTDLDGIEKWPAQPLNKIPGKPAHYLGLLSKPKLHIQVIDPSPILTNHQQFAAKPRFILLVDNKRWGIAVTTVKKVITVTDELVRWRNTTQRPWYSGTLVSDFTHLISISELLKQF